MKTKFLLLLCLLGLGIGDVLAINDYDTAFSCRFSPDTENPWDDQDWSTMYSTWEIIDANGDGNSWTFNRGTDSIGNDADTDPFGGWVQYQADTSSPADDYLVTKNPVRLSRSANTFLFCYKTACNSIEGLTVLYGRSNDVRNMRPIFHGWGEDLFESWTTVDTIMFNIDVSGEYYFAIHANPNPIIGTLYIDNIRILSTGESADPEPDPEPEPTGAYSDLIISEYVEGSSVNKALELYNGTGHSIDLSAYTIMKQTNGRGDYGSPLTLEGTLGNKECYVIVHSGAVEELQSLADLSPHSQCLDFNGNDAVALFKNGIKIDVVGIEGSSEDWGKDVTLRRLPGLGPDSTYKPSQWETCPQNDFSGLGVHGENYANFDSIQTFENQMNRLALHFSGELEEESASNTTNYQLSGGIEILSATLTGENNCVLLETSPMEGETSYTLTATNLKDIFGNTLDPITIDFVSAVEGKIALTAQNFPDANFRNYLSEHFDSDHDGYLSEEECLDVKSIRTTETESRFASLEGLAFFPNLNTLTVAHSTLSSLDITSNTLLRHLDVSFTGLSALDASQNALLETLICSHNALESLDLENNAQLQKLDCQENSLAELNLNHNPLLQYLDCQNNQIQHLEISANTALDTLLCANNQIESLDLTANTTLRNLDCSYNNLLFLDLSSNPELENVVCTNNRRYMEINSDNNTLDLNSIPGFDMGKASHWMGALIEDHTLTFVTETATYQYENGFSGKEQSAVPTSFEFTIVASNFNPDLPDPTAIPIDATNFPDDGFREFIAYNLDQNQDGALSQWEIDAVTKLNLDNIFNIDGIEYFQNLKRLAIGYCPINSIVLTKNLKLKTLLIVNLSINTFFLSPEIQLDTLQVVAVDFSNPLHLSAQTELQYLTYESDGSAHMPEIDLSQCNKLTYLDCSGTLWENLDLSQHPDLQYLDCSGTQIQSLDLANSMNLQHLNCSNTSIQSLDLNHNTNLQYLNCAHTQVSELDLSQNTALQSLYCNGSPGYDVMEIHSIDLSHNMYLKTLDCSSTQIQELDLSHNQNIEHIECFYSPISSIDVTQCLHLKYLDCTEANLSALDLTHNTALQTLFCGENPISSLDLTQNTMLYDLNCSGTTLAGLDLSQNTNLEHCVFGRGSEIDVEIDANYQFNISTLPEFQPERAVSWSGASVDGHIATFESNQASYLYNTGARLSSMQYMPVTVNVINFDEPGVEQIIPIDDIHFPDYTFRTIVSNSFDINGNDYLSQSEIDNATELRSQDFYGGGIFSAEGIEYFPHLQILDLVEACSLASLDVSQNTELRELYCSGNELTSLDLSHNTELQILHCSGNKLSYLDLSQNTKLTDFNIDGNAIMGIDLSQNTYLTYVPSDLYTSSEIQIDENNQIDLAHVPGFSIEKASDWENAVLNGTVLTFLRPDISYRYQTGHPQMPTMIFEIRATNFTDDSEDVVAINATNFPDNTFRSYLSESKFDWNQNGYFSQKEIEGLTELYLSSWEITSLKGIEHLIYLQSLTIKNNYYDLTEVDLSQNTALKYLDCHNSNLYSLNLSKNTELEYLNCSENPINVLDLSQNTKLKYLDCSYNNLENMDLSKNTSLEFLNCSYLGAYLSGYSLDSLVVNSASLDTISCPYSRIESLNVSKAPALVYLDCENNLLTSLDISQNVSLEYLSCNNNHLASLDLSHNPELELVGAYGNIFQAIVDENNRFDLSTIPGFDIEKASDWKFGSISGHILTFHEATVEYIYHTGSPIAEINHSGWIEFAITATNFHEDVVVPDSNGIAINEENFPDEAFREYIRHTIDLNSTGYLSAHEIRMAEEIIVTDLGITSLQGIEFFSALHDLLCAGNQLTELDVRQNRNLVFLDCNNNQLNTLLLPESLESLYCNNNLIKELSINHIPYLTVLSCSNNLLETLDISNNPHLDVLYCSYNHLTSLDLSQNNGLDIQEYFECVGNMRSVSVDTNNRFDLSTLPGFIVNRASHWQGGSVEGNILTFTEKKASYSYYTAAVYTDLGTDTLTFSLEAINFHSGDQPVPDTSGVNINPANFPDSLFRNYVAATFDKDSNGKLNENEIQDAQIVNVDGLGIESMEGIGHLTALRELNCSNNQLVSLDLSANPQLETLSCEGNQRHLILENNTFDLSSLPMDISRTSNWTHAELEGSVLTFLSDTVYYDYDLGYIGTNDIPSAIRFCLTGDFQTGNADREAYNTRVYAHDMTIYIQNASGEIEIYSANGVLQYKGHETQVEMMTQGLYIVRHKGRSWKIMVM